PGQGTRQAEGEPRVAWCALPARGRVQLPFERRPAVVVVALESSQELGSTRATQVRVELLGEIAEVRGVPPPELVESAPLDQPFESVLANGLQEGEACIAVRQLALLHEALVDQGRQVVEDIRAGAADRLGPAECPAAAENRQAAEEALLARGEEVVAPIDRFAKRLLADRTIAGAAGEHGQPRPAPPEP